ncbi:MAG: hypothetical protein MUC58_08625 [Rhizobiaceae bacterium]|jgi:DNA-binding CsgD family transcriptional regulator|nr:hypothetical protein [Rhizobiaceae bacterium]
MNRTFDRVIDAPAMLLAIIAVQIACILFFAGDVMVDFLASPDLAPERPHLLTEAAVNLSLAAAVIVEVRLFVRLLRRKAHLERSATIARAAIHDLIEARFDAWRLTPAERDVAGFLVKGLAISEIARLRGSADGTVKAQLNAIYRKAGAVGRGELLAMLLDDIMGSRTPHSTPSADGRRSAADLSP